MHKLQNTMFKIALIILWIINSSIAFALEVELIKEYYPVFPHNVEDIEAAMIAASPLQSDKGSKTVGRYEASTLVKAFDIAYNNGQCQVNRFSLILNGVMTLPNLPREQTYSKSIYDAFENEQKIIEEHELQHENIWIDHLQKFEHKILMLKVQDDSSCDALIDDINQKMTSVLSEILFENRSLDCASYGKQLHLHGCDE